MAKTKSKTKRKVKGTSRGRKAARAARKPVKVSWLAKGYPVLSSVAFDDCAGAIDWVQEGAQRETANATRRARRNGALRARVRRRGSDAGKPDAAPVLAQKGHPGLRQKLRRNIQRGLERRRALAAGTRRPVLRRSQRTVRGPLGNEWSVMTHVKNVSEKEMKKAMAQMASA